MDGWLANRTPYVSLAGAGIVLAAILGGNTIFAGPGHSSTGPANIRVAATPSWAPTAARSPSPKPSIKSPIPDDLPNDAVYVGRTGRVAVAVAVSGNRAAAYLCDGRRIEAWLTGRIDGDELRLRGKRGARLDGRLTAAGLVGDFMVRGRTYAYQIESADKPAGLYRGASDDGAIVIGWIVLPDGSEVGLQTDASGTRPAPEFSPDGPLRVDEHIVTSEEVSGDDRV